MTLKTVCRAGVTFSLVLGLHILSFAQPTNVDSVDSSLTATAGDPVKGRSLVLSRQTGLCILCHNGPFPEERFQGNLAPDLSMSVAHLSAGQLRARIMDASLFNPATIMPSYYRIDHLQRVSPQFQGKTLLSAQEIEDIVAFLLTLKQ